MYPLLHCGYASSLVTHGLSTSHQKYLAMSSSNSNFNFNRNVVSTESSFTYVQVLRKMTTENKRKKPRFKQHQLSIS